MASTPEQVEDDHGLRRPGESWQEWAERLRDARVDAAAREIASLFEAAPMVSTTEPLVHDPDKVHEWLEGQIGKRRG